MKSHGFPVLSIVDIRTGKVIRCQHAVNTTTYEGADILGKIMAGQTQYIPNMMYFEFDNSGSPPVLISDREGREYYAALESHPTRDYLRVPITLTPSLGPSGINFNTNIVSYTCQESASIGVGGKPFSAAALSVVYGLALVSATDANDRTKDLVYARTYDIAPEEKDDNHQIHITWPIHFS